MKPFYPLPQEIPPLLEGTQTAIVRPLRQQPDFEVARILQSEKRKDIYLLVSDDCESNVCESTPFDQAGTILWCREEFSGMKQIGGRYVREKLHFKATEPDLPSFVRWLQPVMMPLYVSRLWIEVEEIKVCHLSSITAGMAMKLGSATPKALFPGSKWFWYASVKGVDPIAIQG